MAPKPNAVGGRLDLAGGEDDPHFTSVSTTAGQRRRAGAATDAPGCGGVLPAQLHAA